eukprot:scaffold235630_cov15-Tisochrysis_lutea.AAC.1
MIAVQDMCPAVGLLVRTKNSTAPSMQMMVKDACLCEFLLLMAGAALVWKRHVIRGTWTLHMVRVGWDTKETPGPAHDIIRDTWCSASADSVINLLTAVGVRIHRLGRGCRALLSADGGGVGMGY